MVNNKTNIAMAPESATRQLPPMEPHIITDDIEVIPPETHPYAGSTLKLLLVHRYNTGSRLKKCHNITGNHVTTITLTIKIKNPAPTITEVYKTGEDWVNKFRATGKVIIHAGIISAVI